MKKVIVIRQEDGIINAHVESHPEKNETGATIFRAVRRVVLCYPEYLGENPQVFFRKNNQEEDRFIGLAEDIEVS